MAINGFKRTYLEDPGVLKKIQTFGLPDGTYRLFYQSKKGKSVVTVEVNKRSGRKTIKSIKTSI